MAQRLGCLERNGPSGRFTSGGFHLYGHHIRTLRRGKHRLLLWAGQEADGSMQTKTPSKLGVRDEMGRLEKAGKVIGIGYVRSLVTFPSARQEIRAWRLAKVGLVRQYGLQKDGGDTCCKSFKLECEFKHLTRCEGGDREVRQHVSLYRPSTFRLSRDIQ